MNSVSKYKDYLLGWDATLICKQLKKANNLAMIKTFPRKNG